MDGAGKTTLAGELSDALTAAYPGDRVEVLHRGPPVDHPLNEYERPLFGYRPDTGHHVICDRWHLGEWIYPGVLGRPTQADLPTWRHLELFLRSRGALLVHVRPPTDVALGDLRRRGDDLVGEDQARRLPDLYDTLVAESGLRVYRYDRTSKPFGVATVIRTARVAERLARPLNPFETYVGPTRPRYLLLGDVRNALAGPLRRGEKIDTASHGPAFGPLPATSGSFLLRHLPASLDPVGLANACDVDDVEALLEVLGWPTTVALGSNAWAGLRRAVSTGRRPHMWTPGAVPHPQYWRRFLNRYGCDYGDVITRAARGEDLRSFRPEGSWITRHLAETESVL